MKRCFSQFRRVNVLGLAKSMTNRPSLSKSRHRLALKMTKTRMTGNDLMILYYIRTSKHIRRSNKPLLAQRYPHMLRQGAAELTDDIRDRVLFIEHNLFEPQPPLEGGNVCSFLLRQCANN